MTKQPEQPERSLIPHDPLQTTTQRLEKWLHMLEQHTADLLNTNDIPSMKPAEREQAAYRYLSLMWRLLQMQQKCEQTEIEDVEEQMKKIMFGE